MEKKIKTSEISKVFAILNTAKYAKLDDGDKVKLWRIVRKLHPVATKYDDDQKDAAEKLLPSEDFNDRLQKAQEYESARKNGTEPPISEKEYNDFIVELQKYNKLVSEALKELAEKEVTLEYEPLPEEAFGKLMASNEWTMEQVITAGVIAEE